MKKYYIFLIVIFLIIGFKLYTIVNKYEYYNILLLSKMNITILGSTAPRGRILDTNGKVLVDNKSVKAIYYTKLKGISKKDEIFIAEQLSKALDIKDATTLIAKKYYLLTHNNGNDLITKEEYEKLQERKLTSNDIYNIKISRITAAMLENLNKKAAYIYYLMQDGYLKQKKLIKKNVSEEEYAKIVEMNLSGITGELTWERYYPYGNTLRFLFGKVGNIPKEEKELYLANGYQLNDRVGISYLEKEYDEYLKGEKAIYKVGKDGNLVKIKDEVKGNDLVLAIDIDLQLYIEDVIKEIISKGKNYPKTDYYDETYAIIGNPNNGEIKALVGVRLNQDGTYSDVSLNNINKSWTMGSAVKGATISVGYKYNLIEPDKYIWDSCVKLEYVPLKCSHKRLGKINDLTALQESSNYYQYLIAIASTGNTYKSNMHLDVTKDDFNKYRDLLKSYGLGALTEIDLPGEKIGIIGEKIAPDLLLNLAIGQYDTYTPIEMLQYINSIATGKRMSLSLMRNITTKEDILVEHEFNVLNDIPLDDIYLNRIREGFKLVLSKGTGRFYVPQEEKFAGKTGTSESFLDTNNDGVIDTSTITKTFVGYYPYDNPKYSIVLIAPNIAVKSNDNRKIYTGASKITKKITSYLVENY